jgi:hypothetical protein
VKWLVVWLLLTGTYVAVWALSQLWAGGRWDVSSETLAHFALVPLIQTAALAGVALVRRRGAK